MKGLSLSGSSFLVLHKICNNLSAAKVDIPVISRQSRLGGNDNHGRLHGVLGIGLSQRGGILGKHGDNATAASVSSPLLYSVCSVRGERQYMEDEFFVSEEGKFAAVFDGHGGAAVSRYLRQNLYANVQAALPTASTSTLFDPEENVCSARDPSENCTEQGKQRTSTTLSLPSSDELILASALRAAFRKVDSEVQGNNYYIICHITQSCLGS